MATSITLKGFDKLERGLLALPDEIARKVAQDSVRKGAVIIQREAQARAPVQAGDRVHRISTSKRAKKYSKGRKPGFLRASILVRLNRAATTAGSPLVYSIGWSKDAYYGLFQEFGSRHQPARPFLRPAADSKFEEAVAAIGADMGPRIEAAAKKLAGA